LRDFFLLVREAPNLGIISKDHKAATATHPSMTNDGGGGGRSVSITYQDTSPRAVSLGKRFWSRQNSHTRPSSGLGFSFKQRRIHPHRCEECRRTKNTHSSLAAVEA